ncbi:hypothetical protein CTEN210_18176 [Chaetoceros tenuissimus]|uniref:Alpha N-terminal protein methyltransferase 1 n=1 Tax=Chaetoceros tenuissimus TaxID=426638 RepID=A0AAD3HFG4_9STRA|nr:hypothetical protein CTEN210_18176 [Chaetoceros tenuissimus]
MSDEPIANDTKSRRDLIHRLQDYLTKKFQVYSGKDSEGREYEDIQELWTRNGFLLDEETDLSSSEKWYNKSHLYWETEENVQATIDGMLGGFEHLSERDLAASKIFLENLIQASPEMSKRRHENQLSSCECGAGIGRVSKGLFLPFGMQRCDLVETSPRLMQAAPTYIGEEEATKCNFICQGLQEFNPEPNTYDIVWIQWCIAYLTDWDLVNFLYRMGKSLKKGGVIVMKDNTCNELAFDSDKTDGDITRSYQYIRALIEEAGLRIVTNQDKKEMVRWQDDFPDEIWPVPMIAITTKE